MRLHRAHRAPILAIALAALLSGCLTEPESPPPPNSAVEGGSASAATAEGSRRAARRHSESVSHQAELKREASIKRSDVAPAPEQPKMQVGNAAPVVAPTAAPVVSLETPADSRAQAQRMVDQAFQRLGQIDRTWLKGDAATVYDQATALAESGRKALQDGDFTAAEGYARKATTLAADLGENVPQR